MPEAQVAVLRQTFVSGRSRWEQAGAERTNDLGEIPHRGPRCRKTILFRHAAARLQKPDRNHRQCACG